jgi:hypothetical protein
MAWKETHKLACLAGTKPIFHMKKPSARPKLDSEMPKRNALPLGFSNFQKKELGSG